MFGQVAAIGKNQGGAARCSAAAGDGLGDAVGAVIFARPTEIGEAPGERQAARIVMRQTDGIGADCNRARETGIKLDMIKAGGTSSGLTEGMGGTNSDRW